MEVFLLFIAKEWILVLALLTCIGMLLYRQTRQSGASLSPQQLVGLINREDALVIDLRDAAEYRKGHIIDARNIPYAKLKDHFKDLAAYKTKPVVVACKIGQHSGAAGRELTAAGFENVHRLAGGMAEWTNSQMPVVKKDSKKAANNASGKKAKKKKGQAHQAQAETPAIENQSDAAKTAAQTGSNEPTAN